MANEGISRRILHAIAAYQERDWETSLLHLFPAMDATAKKRRPRAGVGERIQAFIRDEEVLITAIASRNVLRAVVVDGVSLPLALYTFARNPLAHEGALDPRISFNDEGNLKIGRDRWDLPTPFILAMAVAVVTSVENAGQRAGGNLCVNIHGKSFMLRLLWGRPNSIRRHLAWAFDTEDLFDQQPNNSLHPTAFGGG